METVFHRRWRVTSRAGFPGWPCIRYCRQRECAIHYPLALLETLQHGRHGFQHDRRLSILGCAHHS